MKQWRITTRIWAVVGLTMAVSALCGGFLYQRMNAITASYEALFDRDVAAQDLSRVMQLTFKKQVQEWKDILLRGHDPQALQTHSTAFQRQAALVLDIDRKLKEELEDPEAREMLDQFATAHRAMMAKYSESLAAFTASGGQAIAVADATVKGQDRLPTDLVDRIVDTVTKRTAARRHAITNSLWMFGVGVVLALLLVSGVAVVVIRGITYELRRTVAELASSANEVAAAASQVSDTGGVLAQGASEQAASLEQTSASAEQTSALTKHNVENAVATTALMGDVEGQVQGANARLEEMVRAMDGISASSAKIANIIKVIDEIAFQTNILALNAAVEAARAGSAGQGFAVVADEVRTLAQRCAVAARQTADLIEESVTMAEGGSSKLHLVVDAIGSITASTTKVRGLVDEVNGSSREQAQGIEEIARAVTEMEQITQQSAAAAEEAASAGQELNGQAAALRNIVERLQNMVDGSVEATAGRPARGVAK